MYFDVVVVIVDVTAAAASADVFIVATGATVIAITIQL